MHRTDKYSRHSSIIWPVWLNGWVYVYELSDCGFDSRCYRSQMFKWVLNTSLNKKKFFYKFRNHLSIVKTKEWYKVKGNFSFKLATTEEIQAIIKDLLSNKAAGIEIPRNILKKSIFFFHELTICVNYVLINGKFPAI